MIDVITDLHLHSKYSRAVSPQMNLSVMSSVAKQKGLEILATGDWTHPIWMKELQNQLVESEDGLFQLKSQVTSSKSQISSNNQKDPSAKPPTRGGQAG